MRSLLGNGGKLLLLGVAAAFVITGCGSDSNSSGSSSSDSTQASSGGSKPLAGKTIKIGVISPHSGLYASAGVTGLNGVKAAVQYLNTEGSNSGAKFEIVARDDKSNPTQAASAARELASSGIDLLIPQGTGGSTVAVMPTVNQAKILTLTGAFQGVLTEGDTNYSKFPWVFNTGSNSTQYVSTQAAYLQANGFKKVAQLYEDDIVGQTFSVPFKAMMDKAGIQLVQQGFPPTAKDVTAQIRKLQQTGAEALFISTYGEPTINAVSSLSKVGWKPKVVLGQQASIDPGVTDIIKKLDPALLKTFVLGPAAKTITGKQPGDKPSTVLAQKWAEYMPKVSGHPLDGTDMIGSDSTFDGVIAWDEAAAIAKSSDSAKVRDVFTSKSLEISWGHTQWPTDRAVAFANDELGAFLASSDLSGGTVQAPSGQ